MRIRKYINTDHRVLKKETYKLHTKKLKGGLCFILIRKTMKKLMESGIYSMYLGIMMFVEGSLPLVHLLLSLVHCNHWKILFRIF